MNILNRGQIVIFPTENFQQWAIKNSDEELFLTSQAEPSVYLIEEEFWEDELVIEKYRKKIMRREFSEISSDDSKWPIVKDNEQFRFYFNAFLGLIVVDLLETDLTCEEMDL
jgi:hypothetical protein